MAVPAQCRHTWQLEGVTLGACPLAWWWCRGGCGSQALGAPTFTDDQPGTMLLPAVYVPTAVSSATGLT